MPKKLSKRKGPGRVGPAKIRDVEYLSWLKATLNEGWLTASMIHDLALEQLQGPGGPDRLGGREAGRNRRGHPPPVATALL